MSIIGSNRFNIILIVILALLMSCSEAPKESPPEQLPETTSMRPPPSNDSAIAVGHGSTGSMNSQPSSPAQTGGSAINWVKPDRWQTGPERMMRAATYLIPAASGDSEGAECAVFRDIQGGVDANIQRWIGQFEQPDGSPSNSKAVQKKETINGLPVTTIDLNGTYTGGGVAMGQTAPKKPGFRLLGAIIETAHGEVFFKLTGPAKTVESARREFQGLLKSIN